MSPHRLPGPQLQYREDWRTHGEPAPSGEVMLFSLLLGAALGAVLLVIGFGWLL